MHRSAGSLPLRQNPLIFPVVLKSLSTMSGWNNNSSLNRNMSFLIMENKFSQVTLSLLAEDDLCNLCTHGVSTRAKTHSARPVSFPCFDSLLLGMQARLECGSERHCNKGTARTCADLPPTREAQHTTQWLPRVGQGEHWGCSLFHRIVQFGGHHLQHTWPM